VSAKLRLLIFLVPLTLTACEWFTDFKRQPSVWTWEPLKDSLTPSRGNPQMSVPIGGSAVAGFQVSYGAFPATIDSMAGIPNPTPVSDASLLNGRKYFQINCSPCHGERGMGDGTATRYGMPGINLTQDITKARTDGYIFGMIRNGRGLMPSYNRIEESDRWDVVNYVRALQGMNGRTVPVGPLAAPGVTGDKVPRATRMGPNVPAPFFSPRSLLTPGQSTPSAAAAAQQGLPAGTPAATASPTAPKGSDTSAARTPRTGADSAKRAADIARRGIR
jgi:mono/diheme cytochrome c family protein